MYLFVVSSLGSQTDWNWIAIPYCSCYCHKKLLRGAVAGCGISSLLLLETRNRDGIGQLSLIRAVIVVEQLQVFASHCCYFLILPIGVKWGSYHLLELLMSKDAPARSCCPFLHAALSLLGYGYMDIFKTAFLWELHENQLFPQNWTEFGKFACNQNQVENKILHSNLDGFVFFVHLNIGLNSFSKGFFLL